MDIIRLVVGPLEVFGDMRMAASMLFLQPCYGSNNMFFKYFF